MKYVDIHCHLDFPDYDADREEVLRRMKENQVGAITIGTDLESSKRAVEIAEQNENVWVCIGVHPDKTRDNILPAPPEPFSLREKWQNIIPSFSDLIASPKVIGIGECGLDYFHIKNESEKIFQIKLFESQIQFAVKHNKPLMHHIRDAYDDALEILLNYKKEEKEKLRGNVHFFCGR